MPSSLKTGFQSDTLGILNCECMGASDIHKGSSYQVDKIQILSNSLKSVGMDQEVSEGMNADLGFTPNSVENHVSIRSTDSDNEHVHAPHSSFSQGNSKSKKRQPKPIKKINPVLMTLGEDVLLNDIVLTNALTLVGRFGR